MKRREAGVLERVSSDPLAFFLQFAGGELRTLRLLNAELKPGANVAKAFQPALGQTVEVEIRTRGAELWPAGIWFPEPVIEDSEVEYVSFLHLRTFLPRNGCLKT